MEPETTEAFLIRLRDEFNNSPFWRHLGIRADRLQEGDVRIAMPAAAQLLNVHGLLHGGAIVALLDSAVGFTIRSLRGVGVVTVSLTTNFIAPVREGTLYASATVLGPQNPGGHLLQVEARVADQDQRLIATAQGVFAVVRERHNAPAAVGP